MPKPLPETSILMISLDAGLLHGGSSGDVIARHQRYAQNLRRLDILVLSGRAGKTNDISDNCRVYGLGKKISSIQQAYKLGSRLLAKHKYDLIDTQDPHLTGLVGYWLKRKFGIKLEVHFHGDFWHNSYWIKESLKNRFFSLVQRLVVPKADAIRVVNPKIRDDLLKSGLKDDIIRVINTPINQGEFMAASDEADIEAIRRQYDGKKILLFVGRLVATKNLPFLLKTVAKLKQKRNDFVVLIIGEGPLSRRTHSLRERLKLQDEVFMLGAKSPAEVHLYNQSADLAILLSTNESFGKTVIEAGLAAKATLASATAGPQHIIEDGQNGWLVPINNREATLEKLEYILDNIAVAEQAGRNAQDDFTKRFSQAETFQKVQGFWLDIVNNSL